MMDQNLVSAFASIVSTLSPCFTAPTRDNFRILVAGWVLCPGRRTVTNLVRSAGAAEDGKDWSRFHRFFSRARWDLDEVGGHLVRLIVKLLVPEGVIELAVDDTLGRKRGRHIWGASFHRDGVRSSGGNPVFSFGHNWVVLSIQVSIGCLGGKVMALPVLFRLYRSKEKKRGPGRPKGERKRTGAASGREYRTRPDLAVEMIVMLAGWLEGRKIRLTGDSEYCGGSVVRHLPGNVHMVGRTLMNAALYERVPKRRKGERGAPRKKGPRLPPPKEMLASRKYKWRKLRVNIYGRKVTIKVKTLVCLWYRPAGSRPVRVVVTRDPKGKRRDDCFFSTDVNLSPTAILEAYANRWPLETCFHDAKQSLGFEDPQNRVRKAVERTAPMAMVVHTLVVIWYAKYGHVKGRVLQLHGPWYRRKKTASFADMLATLRIASWDERIFEDPSLDAGSRELLEPLRAWIRAAA